MKIITIEEHYTDQRIIEANNAFNKAQKEISSERAEGLKLLGKWAYPGEALINMYHHPWAVTKDQLPTLY